MSAADIFNFVLTIRIRTLHDGSSAPSGLQSEPMNRRQRLTFRIDAYSPETIPMAKLAGYMGELAAVLGTENRVHFSTLESGSTVIAAHVEHEDIPKVRHRVTDLRRGLAAPQLTKAFDTLDKRLAEDNATGGLFLHEGHQAQELLIFAGRDRPRPVVYGPFLQDGHLDGVLIAVGGKDDTVPLRLQSGDVTYANCETTRTIARELGKHLFLPIRIHGCGTWLREGGWVLKRFKVDRFEALDVTSLRDTVTALRQVDGNGWKDVSDPLAMLADLRAGEDDLH